MQVSGTSPLYDKHLSEWKAEQALNMEADVDNILLDPTVPTQQKIKLINLSTEFLFHKTLGIVAGTTPFVLFFYLYKSLKNHFGQSRSKTILKFFILNILTIIL